MLSSTVSSDFSMKNDLFFVTDGTKFIPSINLLEKHKNVDRHQMYCQLASAVSDGEDGSEMSKLVPERRICDTICDCYDCSDEDENVCSNTDEVSHEHILGSKIIGLRFSPTLEELTRSGFWKIIKINSNGSTSFKIPFGGGPHKRLELKAVSVGSRGKHRNDFDKVTFSFHFKHLRLLSISR